MKRYASIMIAACLLALFPIWAMAAPVGKFTYLEGQVDVLPPGQAAKAATLGDEVNVGETLRTKSRSKAEVTFYDGHILRLAEKTALEVKEYESSEGRFSGIIRLSRGKIQNIIKTAAARLFGLDKKNRFEVHTPTAVVGVRGTNFFSYYLREISGAAFQEGLGYGYNPNKPEVVKDIKAGQAMVVAGPDKIPVIKPATDVEIQQHINDTSPSGKPDEKKEGSSSDTGEGTDASLLLAETGDAGPGPRQDGAGTEESPGPSQTVVIDIPPTITSPLSLGVDFSGSLNLDFLESGTMSGSFSETSGMSDLSVSGILLGPAPTPHYGDVSGTMSDGSAFAGYLGGAVGSWNAVFASLYAKEGNIGYFYGNLSGHVNGTLSGSGSVYRTPGYGSLTLVPEEGQTLTDALYHAMSPYLFDAGRLPIISSLDMSTGAVQGNSYSSETLGIQTSTGRVLGIWRALTTDGYFSNPYAQSSNTFLYGQYGMQDYYLLGQVSASDNLNGHAAINGTLTYMDLYYMGDVSLWYNGTYNSPYSSAGIGTFTLDPLAYTGYWNYYYPAACLFSNESGYFSYVGADYGIFGGTQAPWDHDISPFRAMGNYSYDYSVSGPHLLWNTSIDGWGPNDDYHRILGFTGGIWKDVEGSIYGTQYGNLAAIYMTSDGRAGTFTSTDLAGYHYPELSIWINDGNLVRHQMTTVGSPYDYEPYYSSSMDGRLVGGYDGIPGAIWGWTYSGTTLFFKNYTTYQSLPWGIYDLKLGYGNTFYDKPAGSANWSAMSGGTGVFGYTINGGEQLGYWIGPVSGTWTDEGEITGNLSGTYLTLAHLGTLNGPFTGINNGTGYGTWIGQSIGTFQGQPLTYSSDFRLNPETYAEIPLFRLVPGTTYEGDYGIWDAQTGPDTAHYDYEYFLSQGTGNLLFGEKETEGYLSSTSYGEHYFPDGMYLGSYEYRSPFSSWRDFSEGTWTVGTQEPSYFSTPPNPGFGTWERHGYWEWPSNSLEQSGTVAGLLGGTGDLWNASAQSPAGLNLMGEYSLNAVAYLGPSLFGTPVYQSFDTTGGAYYGFLGGVLSAQEAVGGLYALYIAENGGAGVLEGIFSGPVYPSLNMWEASGTIYPIPMTQEMAVLPSDLQYNLASGFIAAWVDGNFGSQDSFLTAGLGWGRTVSITGYSDWGVFALWLGYDNWLSNPASSGTWNARAGGWAEFGTIAGTGGAADLGMWISSPLTGSSGNGFLSADFSGKFLTYAKYGDLTGRVIGTYDVDTWQGIASGYWSNSQKLMFNGALDARTAATRAEQQGHWDDGAGSYYDYTYFPYLNTGWSSYYDASANTKQNVEYYADGTKEWWTDSNGVLSSSEGTWSNLLNTLKTGGPAETVVQPGAISYSSYESGWIDGFMGGLTDLWSATATRPAELTFMGEYDDWSGADVEVPVFSARMHSYNPYDYSSTIWNQEDNSQNGAYFAYAAGYGPKNDALYASILGFYVDKNGNIGFVKGGFNGQVYQDLEMWQGAGTIYPMKILPNTGYDAGFMDQFVWFDPTSGPLNAHGQFMDFSSGDPTGFGDIHWLSYDREKANIYSDGQTWRLGVTSVLYGGTFSGTTSDYWAFPFTTDDGTLTNIGAYISDPDQPGAWSNGVISGKAYQAWVNWDHAVTGVGGGEIKGTFDPTGRTFQAAALWAHMDTKTFMGLASNAQGREKLTALNIPCIEIGKTDLSQGGGTVNNLQNVTMHDVTFYAYSTGAAPMPRTWATNLVDGNYVGGGPSTPGLAVPLTGSGLSANFQAQRWDGAGGNWGANVAGGGTYTGTGTMSGMNITMGGSAAGKIAGDGTSGTFSGTGSGVAKKN